MAAAAWRRRAIICFTRALRPSALSCAQQHGELSRAGGKQWNRPARRAAWRGEKKRAGGGGLRLEPAPASNQHQHTRGEFFTVSRLSSDSNIFRALRRAARSLSSIKTLMVEKESQSPTFGRKESACSLRCRLQISVLRGGLRHRKESTACFGRWFFQLGSNRNDTKSNVGVSARRRK